MSHAGFTETVQYKWFLLFR